MDDNADCAREGAQSATHDVIRGLVEYFKSIVCVLMSFFLKEFLPWYLKSHCLDLCVSRQSSFGLVEVRVKVRSIG